MSFDRNDITTVKDDSHASSRSDAKASGRMIDEVINQRSTNPQANSSSDIVMQAGEQASKYIKDLEEMLKNFSIVDSETDKTTQQITNGASAKQHGDHQGPTNRKFDQGINNQQ